MEAPKGHCRGCQKPVKPPRTSWCSDDCVRAALVRLDPGVARSRVEERDHGVCAECGFDAEKAERILRRVRYGAIAVLSINTVEYRERQAVVVFLVNLWNQPKRPYVVYGPHDTLPHLWEADHIVPVVEGGGGCDLDNYRTLCIPCHRRHTLALAAKRAEARRMSKMTLLNDTGDSDGR